jgi:hypothetical protein
MSRPLLLVLVFLGALGGVARAEVQAGVPEVFPSRNEISVHTGFQAGFGGHYTDGTSGFKLEGDYAYRFHPLLWFDVSVGNNFGFGNGDGPCAHVLNTTCYRGGWALELLAGLKLKWALQRVPIVIEAPVQVGVEVLYNRDCGDNGAGVPVLRTGGGAMYFLTKKIGVGLKIDFAGGPAFHGSGTACGIQHSYTDFYGYFDFMLGAEFFL